MAVNTSVFTGADAVLALAIDDPSSVEGTEAQTVIEGFELGAVGRATDVEVYVTTDLRSFHEIGKRLPTQLHQGNINISGKIGRAYINGGLLSLLLGKYADPNSGGSDPLPQPSFNLVMAGLNPAFPNNTSVVTVRGVKLENWAFAMPEDDFIMESVSFKGMAITVVDAAG
jgi:hypothetical protein